MQLHQSTQHDSHADEDINLQQDIFRFLSMLQLSWFNFCTPKRDQSQNSSFLSMKPTEQDVAQYEAEDFGFMEKDLIYLKKKVPIITRSSF